MRQIIRLCGALASVCLAAGTARAAIIYAAYEFQGSYHDSANGPGVRPDATPDGPNPGILGADTYAFNPNSGITLQQIYTDTNHVQGYGYTIAMRFQLASVAGYVKLLDTRDRDSHGGGLFVRDGTLDFVESAGDHLGVPGAVAADQFVTVTVTRSYSTNNLAVYLDGVQQVLVADYTGIGGFFTNNMHFFENDVNSALYYQASEATSAGVVDWIRIYSDTMDSDEAYSLFSPQSTSGVPEPATATLLGGGVVSLLCYRGRRRKSTAAA